MVHVSCLYAYDLYMLHMLFVHMFHIVMDMFVTMITMIYYLLYVVIIMLICGIKMTWKLSNITSRHTGARRARGGVSITIAMCE